MEKQNNDFQFQLSRVKFLISNQLVDQLGFFGQLVFSAKVAAGNVGTACTDGNVLTIDEKYFNTLSELERVALLMHEVIHDARRDWTGRTTYGITDWDLWNKATDYCVNREIDKAGLPLGPGWLFDKKYADKQAIEIYRELQAEKKAEKQENGKGEKQDQGENGNGPGTSGDTGKDNSEENGQGQEQGQDEENGQEKPGSGSGNGENPDHKNPVNQCPSGKFIEPDNVPEAEEKAVERVRRAEIAWSIAGKQGTAAGEFIAEVTAVKTDLVEIIRRFARSAGKNRQSYRRPNRRRHGFDAIFPEISGEALKAVVAIDVSGSMYVDDSRAIKAAFGAIAGVFGELTDCELRIICCDTRITYDKVLAGRDCQELIDDVNAGIPGGGGTLFKPVFSAIEESPDCLVYFTDMQSGEGSSSFPDNPGYPVLWVRANGSDIVPGFGEVVDGIL